MLRQVSPKLPRFKKYSFGKMIWGKNTNLKGKKRAFQPNNGQKEKFITFLTNISDFLGTNPGKYSV